jgi:hypothetical protein
MDFNSLILLSEFKIVVYNGVHDVNISTYFLKKLNNVASCTPSNAPTLNFDHNSNEI